MNTSHFPSRTDPSQELIPKNNVGRKIDYVAAFYDGVDVCRRIRDKTSSRRAFENEL